MIVIKPISSTVTLLLLQNQKQSVIVEEYRKHEKKIPLYLLVYKSNNLVNSLENFFFRLTQIHLHCECSYPQLVEAQPRRVSSPGPASRYRARNLTCVTYFN